MFRAEYYTKENLYHRLYYSCAEVQHMFGMGFIINRRIISRVIDFKPVDKRLCVLRIKVSFQNYSFICAHAPTEDKSVIDKEHCYGKLVRIYEECARYIKIIMGDMNTKVDKETWISSSANDHWRNILPR